MRRLFSGLALAASLLAASGAAGQVKVSALPNAQPLNGPELAPMVQSGVTVKATADQLADFVIAVATGQANTWTDPQTFVAEIFTAPSTTGAPGLNIPLGTAPASPSTGDLWNAGGNLFFRSGATTQTLAFLSSSITGSAGSLATPHTIAMTGDVVWTSGAFNGTGNVTGSAAIQPGAVTGSDIAAGTVTGSNIASATVTNTNLAVMAADSFKCNPTGSGAAVQDCNASTAGGLLSSVASALKLTTARTIATTGDLVFSLNFDGSANVSAAAAIQSGVVSLADLANIPALTILCNPTAGSATPQACSESTVATMVGAGGGGGGAASSLSPGGTISITGDLAYTSPVFTGANVTAAGTIQAGVVTAAKLAAGAAASNIGYTSAHAGANGDITSLSGLSTPLSTAQGGTGNGSGNAPTASALQTARTIALSGGVSGSTSFDGSGNVTISATPNFGTTAGTIAQGNDSRFGGPSQNSQSASYTLVLGDAGGQVYHPSADTTARTWTIPANASVGYAVGTKIDLVNDMSAGAITIAISSDTLVFFPTGATGTRTLSAGGEATLTKVSATRWIITGVGLSWIFFVPAYRRRRPANDNDALWARAA